MLNLLLVDGSVHGSSGNTSAFLDIAEETLSKSCNISRLQLIGSPQRSEILQQLEAADGFLFGTGTYWDSWGSPLQKFLEEVTDTEGTALWLGKPAAVIVTMYAVGGKGILSRLQGVLNTFGALIPPMSGIVCSAVNQLALNRQISANNTEDLWRPEDIEVVCHNLWQAMSRKADWRSWSLDRESYRDVWFEK